MPVPFCEMDAVKYLGDGVIVLWMFASVAHPKKNLKKDESEVQKLQFFIMPLAGCSDQQIMKSSGRNHKFIKGMV